MPWYGSFRGGSDVPRFFKEIGSNVEVSEFTIVSMTSNDTDVGRNDPEDLHRVRDRQYRVDAHAALVAPGRRQDRVLPRV